MRTVPVALAFMVLCACSPTAPDAPNEADGGPVAVLPADPPPPAEPPSPWTMEGIATTGASIIFADKSGVQQLRIVCHYRGLTVDAPAFTKIDSEERLTLGAGDELATLVVSQDTPASQLLSATGELPKSFVDALAQGKPIAVSYGATQIGPLPPLPAEMLKAFTTTCRQLIREN